MTDQQQGAALSCAGNGVLKTPHLDRLAAGGVRFERAYSACPICVPARTTILTGHSLCATGIGQNGQLKRPLTGGEGVLGLKTFHERLVERGDAAEYWGKWHTVEARAACFANRASMDEGKKAYNAFLEKNGFKIPKPAKGEFIDAHTGCPYRPDPLDLRTTLEGNAPPNDGAGNGESREQKREQRKAAKGKREGLEDDEDDSEYGLLRVPRELSPTAHVGRNVCEALERLAGGPFTLTGSFGAPHPPMVVCEPYYGMYPPSEMPIPKSQADPMTHSPYAERAKTMERYRDAGLIGYMISNYYAMVKEVDDWVGRILDTLDRLGLAENTLVVFTSDHGELLGAHGMYSKMVFYDEASRVPLLARFPWKIPPGTVVGEPVGHLDIYATILDYLGCPAGAHQGESLRGLVDREPNAVARRVFTVSEWPHRHSPNYMVRTRDFKFLFAGDPRSPSLDALWNLKDDPDEMNNLLGTRPDRAKWREQAEWHKSLLVSWLDRVGSPDRAGVKARPVMD
ncbi:MAG: sulfatase-like hydrolase/transferase [Spirochaetes bacterium]|nr:sulfatase-like hydrolase/transferase [Spirochaetota bacterium]